MNSKVLGKGNICKYCQIKTNRYVHTEKHLEKLYRKDRVKGWQSYWDICISCNRIYNYREAHISKSSVRALYQNFKNCQ